MRFLHRKKLSTDLHYPLKTFIFRELPADYVDVVHVWDVDKTYLDTHFSSMRGMARIPVEFSVDKHPIAGMPAILRGLRWGGGPAYKGVPIFFVTASPPFMQTVLRHRMTLDGIEYDGLLMKDWAGCIKGLRPGRLREQLGFKVCALLSLRLARPMSWEYLYGDDTEDDARAYALYARLISGDLSAGEMEQVMADNGIKRDDRRCILRLTDRLGYVTGRVHKAFIHLENGHSPESFTGLGDVVVPVHGAVQLAMALFQDGQITLSATKRTILACSGHPRWKLTPSMVEDAIKRGLISAKSWHALEQETRIAQQ